MRFATAAKSITGMQQRTRGPDRLASAPPWARSSFDAVASRTAPVIGSLGVNRKGRRGCRTCRAAPGITRPGQEFKLR